jgi:hypothetical protein
LKSAEVKVHFSKNGSFVRAEEHWLHWLALLVSYYKIGIHCHAELEAWNESPRYRMRNWRISFLLGKDLPGKILIIFKNYFYYFVFVFLSLHIFY